MGLVFLPGEVLVAVDCCPSYFAHTCYIVWGIQSDCPLCDSGRESATKDDNAA